jgi:hypothetical protein
MLEHRASDKAGNRCRRLFSILAREIYPGIVIPHPGHPLIPWQASIRQHDQDGG